MKRILLCALCFIGLAGQMTVSAKELPVIKVTGLECNYQSEPLGIDQAQPQFSWRIESNVRNTMQSAWQVIVASSPEKLAEGQADMWDSGMQPGSHSTGIIYQGATLNSRGRYYWKARTTLADGSVTPWSEPASFEMGLLHEEDWWGGWIGYATGMPGRVLYFKATVAYGKKPVKDARIYIAGLGFYELMINGKKVGDHVLDPAQSSYSKTIYYATYDVSDCFSEEANTIVVAVAPGFIGTPKLRMQMHVLFEDGTQAALTAGDMRAITAGSTMYTTIFDGEHFDAREENPELYEPYRPAGLMNKVWGLAYNTDEPVGKMVSQQMEPIKVVETFAPAAISEPQPGVYVVDAGRNMAGWISVSVKGMAGKKVTMRYAETVRDNGLVNQDNLRNAKSEDSFIPATDDQFSWEPRFTYHGFRFIQIEGLETAPKIEDIQVKAVRSSMDRTSSFTCSNQLLNDINTMVINTESSNFHSVPTDCPQRDERMGWLNDLTVSMEPAFYNFDMARFFPKFFWDVVDTQGKDGTITCVAPFRFGARPADPVCASFLLLAYNSYKFYGNKSLIIDGFDNMKAWVDYLHSRTKDGIVDYSYYGDWCPPREFLIHPDAGVSKYTPGLMISTGYLYYCAKILSQMAQVAGRTEDAAEYSRLADATAAAMNREYWDEAAGGYGTNNQAANSFALFLGIVPEKNIQRVVDNLVADVVAHDYHLTTGNLCTKYLLEMLTEYGHKEEAYRIATQTTYPGWGFMLANGATTLWERWEYLTGDAMNSHNHPMMGSIGSWFHKYVAGISPEFEKPAYEHFTIKPYIFDELDFAEGELETVKGTIKSAWHKKGRSLTLDVTIPANSTATVWIPSAKGYTAKEVGSGTYQFKTSWK
ncbi:MAG: family 78 glycoside hydrolase catalytic domain [Bacteroidales bacterium]|nr:family 78 glycoside hydrolase catalytic domain [Candidatus Cryptobacteroides faecihippi]